MSNQTDTILTNITPMMDHKLCPACTVGRMKMLHNSVALMTHPVQYHHQCDTCFHTAYYTELYPRVIYLNAEPTNE